MMMWDDPQTQPPPQQQQQQQRPDQDFCFNFDLLSLLSRPKDYYKILEVDYDATDDAIRSNYIRLALKWHPDKQKDEDSATSRFQEINEAYQDGFLDLKCHEHDDVKIFAPVEGTEFLSDPVRKD
ncbi:chaperone protein DnaJ [Populus alba x Populus x berolinensis]|uniref:Chaperone protein DnaJ n=1 Tax=Populus alba x Populus x berolinensis TaxID=444605 RepID=A0AAD6WAG8_9ROSI|nr:chaperone protein DnaJ [Populus alba x Populus x berolinensis]